MKNLKKLGLQPRRHFADFVEKDCAAVRVLKFPELPLLGAGKRSLFEAKELALEQFRRQRRAVHFDKWALAAVAQLVEGSGHKFLPRPALSADQNRDVRIRNLLDGLPHFSHLGVVTAKKKTVDFAPDSSAKIHDFFLESVSLQGFAKCKFEFFDLKRLAQKVRCPQPHRFDDHTGLPVTGEHDDRHLGQGLLEFS